LSTLDLGDAVTLRSLLDQDGAPWLVNLSACETGILDMTRSERAVSFATAFLASGADHVVATLWPVSDAAAAAFNSVFYEHLGQGADPADASQAAISAIKRPLVNATRTVPVSEWAGFVIYGRQ
jgi:CHAT domain-containing protein